MASHVIKSQWQQPKYKPLGQNDVENELSSTSTDDTFVQRRSRPWISTCGLVIAALLISSTLLQSFLWSQGRFSSSGACVKPPVRREWRSLTTEERHDFVEAVKCLGRTPSTWTHNGTLYDDFTHLHGSIGSWSHRSASFLPWHRWTLHLWESTLKEVCGFQGSIPYWDWTRDWMNLANSSIWDGDTGFGGNGNRSAPDIVGNGSCVADGPFIGLRPIMYNHTYMTHCLSRGFNDDGTLGRLPGKPFSPESIGKILRQETYKDFVKELEYRLHNVMHQSIAGDFLALTAANDPIFFVHHAQLDHLWWQWQMEDQKKRLHEYNGKHMYNSTDEEASMTDMLMYGGFSEDIPVSKVMRTENGDLCYKY